MLSNYLKVNKPQTSFLQKPLVTFPMFRFRLTVGSINVERSSKLFLKEHISFLGGLLTL